MAFVYLQLPGDLSGFPVIAGAHSDFAKRIRGACDSADENRSEASQQLPSAAPSIAIPVLSPKPSRPLSTHGWTASENEAVACLLGGDRRTAFDTQHSPGGIYAVFSDLGSFGDWSERELEMNARVLQLGLMKWRSHKIEELRNAAQCKGKRCMMAPIQARDWTKPSIVEPWYVKTAGDMLQSYWVWQRRLDSRYHFGYGACQTAFAEWIWLRHCVLGDVGKWNKHSVADLCETVTLYLPVGLADHYLMCLANYHKLKLAHLDVPRCQFASSYPCYKIAEKGQNFCRMHRNKDVL